MQKELLLMNLPHEVRHQADIFCWSDSTKLLRNNQKNVSGEKHFIDVWHKLRAELIQSGVGTAGVGIMKQLQERHQQQEAKEAKA